MSSKNKRLLLATIVVGVGVVALQILFPPYVSCGNIMCDEKFGSIFSLPPKGDLEYTGLDQDLLIFEVFLTIYTAIAFLAMKDAIRRAPWPGQVLAWTFVIDLLALCLIFQTLGFGLALGLGFAFVFFGFLLLVYMNIFKLSPHFPK
ncbi:MAG: hypothetical protein ABJA67_17190 [Chthonomonadales bacterium]